MAEIFSITSSSVVAFWQLVMIVSRQSPISVETAIQISRDSGQAGGNVPANDGLKLGLTCNFFSIDENRNLQISTFCSETLLPMCQAEEPNVDISRAVISKYMSFQNLEWLLFFDQDPQIFRTAIPDDWTDLLDNSGLFDFEDSSVTGWWSEIFARFETYEEGKKLEQGRVAEMLTYNSERVRLINDAFDPNTRFVVWASRISDKYGYDILSARGELLKQNFNQSDKIHIEVKCTASDSIEGFRFFVSRNEWKVALENMNSYYFFCWVNTNIQRQSAVGPYIIPAIDLLPHIPTESGDLCTWSECRFLLNLSQIKIN